MFFQVEAGREPEPFQVVRIDLQCPVNCLGGFAGQAAAVGRCQRVRVIGPCIGIAAVELQGRLIRRRGWRKFARHAMRAPERKPRFDVARLASGHGIQFGDAQLRALCCVTSCWGRSRA